MDTWWRRHRPRLPHLAVDVLVAVSTAVIDYYGAYSEAHNPVQGDPTLKLPTVPSWAYLLVVFAGLALLGRRRWPHGTFVVVLTLTVGYTVLGYNDGAPLLAVAVGLYSLATNAGARATWTALAVSIVLIVVALSLFEPFGLTQGPLTVLPFEMLAGAGSGFAVANRRAQIAQMRDRAEQAERTREEEAHRRVDAERLRIARELHDVVAHSMATINVQAGVAVHLLREQPDQVAQAVEALEAVRSISKEALGELRGILNLLRSSDEADPMAPVPGLSQLDDLVAVSARAGLATAVEVTGDPRRLPAAVDLTAYRVVQEALTNTLRHAGPAQATVRLLYGPVELHVEVSDDGRGPTGPGSSGTDGNGLRGMRERAEAVGGQVRAGPGDSGGFVVRAVLPYGPVAQPASSAPSQEAQWT
jgi:signal transduction histidine kinase